tara:strand:+ start:16421 stop:16618 length:198 start_codon:yes stop_codon:yes gene_type:complete
MIRTTPNTEISGGRLGQPEGLVITFSDKLTISLVTDACTIYIDNAPMQFNSLGVIGKYRDIKAFQ